MVDCICPAESQTGIAVSYRPDFCVIEEGQDVRTVVLVEVSIRHTQSDVAAIGRKKLPAFCREMNKTQAGVVFKFYVVALSPGPQMVNAVNSDPVLMQLNTCLRSQLRNSLKSLNFAIHYVFNRCLPETCRQVVASGDMGETPVQNRLKFTHPVFSEEETAPVAGMISEKGLPHGTANDVPDFLWARGEFAHEVAGRMTEAHSNFTGK